MILDLAELTRCITRRHSQTTRRIAPGESLTALRDLLRIEEHHLDPDAGHSPHHLVGVELLTWLETELGKEPCFLASPTGRGGSLPLACAVEVYLARLRPRRILTRSLARDGVNWVQVIAGNALPGGPRIHPGDGVVVTRQNGLQVQGEEQAGVDLLLIRLLSNNSASARGREAKGMWS